ncbi:MAG: TIGR03790 family protein [Planctomycetes bacterium]|nr:TIGR03790 family protein [Planctomycetota bacterium]
MNLLRIGWAFGLAACLATAAAADTPAPPPLGTAAAPAEKPDDANLRPDEVLVIANSTSADSLAVAKYYMEKRGIPMDQLFTVAFKDYNAKGYEISFNSFENGVTIPLRKFLEERKLKDKILCFVTVYDVPYAVSGIQVTKEELDQIAKEHKVPNPGQVLTTRAALDSELAWLYRGDLAGLDPKDIKYRSAYCYLDGNPFFGQPVKFRQFRKNAATNPKLKDFGTMYMTARLEAPSVALAKGLVDKAMEAERDGPSGIGYFDSKGPTLGNRKMGYPEGEFWARRAWLETHNAGFKTVKEETGKLFGPGECPDALIYWGWYALTNYQNAFNGKFRPGAIAVHTASGEATDIRTPRESGGPWCGGFLTHGVTVTSGPVGEPFLNAFPHAEIFYPRLYQGWSIGDAYWNSHFELSWMMVLIGDPLYTPFGGKNRRAQYVQTALLFSDGGPPGQKVKSKGACDLALMLKAQTPIFKNTDKYKVVDPGVSGPKLKVTGLDKLKCELKEDGTLLVITGPKLEAADLGAFDPKQEMGPELEVHVDLGPDGGEKIVSQLLAW